MTLLIFDWDDTLLPSTWLNAFSDDHAPLNEISKSVAYLLTEARAHGDIAIVTNGTRGWVESSCRQFMPQCLPLLKNIRIVSARSTYEPQYKDSPIMWKLLTFENIAANYSHVISIGDSHAERHALLQLRNKRYTKTIKTEEYPTLDTFMRQLEMLPSIIDVVVEYSGNIDISYESMQTECTLQCLERPRERA